MNTTIIDFISSYGYLAVAILIAVENIFPPIPSEIILTFPLNKPWRLMDYLPAGL